MVDYYSLLAIAPDTNDDGIRTAIRQARRKWSNRQNNPNAEIRAEAEKMMRDISEAERVLLDPEKRNQYDADREIIQPQREMDSCNQESSKPRGFPGWRTHAEELFRNGQFNELCVYMAPIVAENNGDIIAWFLYGLGQINTPNYKEGIACMKKVLSMDSHCSPAMRALGNCYYDHKDYAEAEAWYTRGTKYDSAMRIDIADAQNKQRKYSEALATASIALDEQKNNDQVKEIYARCLRDHTFQSLSVDELNGIYEITNKNQLDYMKKKIPLFNALLPSTNYTVCQIVNTANDILSNAERNDFSIKPLIPWFVGIIILFVLNLAAINFILIPITIYKWWKMKLPHYKTSRSTVDRRTGLQ